METENPTRENSDNEINKLFLSKRYIDRVGVELEGGWAQTPRDMVSDCSVRIDECDESNPCADCYNSSEYRCLNCGEEESDCCCEDDDRDVCEMDPCEDCQESGDNGMGVSGEVRIGALGLKVPEVYREMVDKYPDFVNDSCGLHTHISFESRLNLATLLHDDFPPYLIKGLENWGERTGIPGSNYFWERLEGENQYCEKNQKNRASDYRKLTANRYQQVNYSSFRRHGTMEIRVLPMFLNPITACQAISEVFRLSERFLVAHSTNQKEYSLSLLV